jgi:hypothetical protein
MREVSALAPSSLRSMNSTYVKVRKADERSQCSCTLVTQIHVISFMFHHSCGFVTHIEIGESSKTHPKARKKDACRYGREFQDS